MNYRDPYPPNTSRHNPRAGPSRRPATISELAERANISWDESKGVKYYLKLAEKCRREGKEYARSGDMENAFIELAKAATLMLEKLPELPDYEIKLNPSQRHNLGLNGQEVLDNIAELKPAIINRYEKWRQTHLNGVDEDIMPNFRTQQLANDDAARAKAQGESQIRDEEAARAIRQKDQARMAAEESNKWLQQHQQLKEEERPIVSAHSMHQSSAKHNIWKSTVTPPQNNDYFLRHTTRESKSSLANAYHTSSTSTSSSTSANTPSATPNLTTPAKVTTVPLTETPERTKTGWNIAQTPGAKIDIHGGTFFNVAGNSTHVTNPPSSDERGLEILLQGIESDAMHDSAKRYPPPKCHPNTRVRILEEIKRWINDAETQYPVFWLHARAGEGKSAIMQFIAELMLIPKGKVVATFFFGRGKGKREQAQYLFSTLAYQLALNIPALRHSIEKIMRKKPTLPSSSMDVQVQYLFFNTFSELEDQPHVPWTILIDGLDECNSPDDQQSILGLIAEIITFHGLPLRFLIASRPEPQIRAVFDGPTLRRTTLRATIVDDFNSRQDIEKFLRDSFNEIYQRKSQLIGKIQGLTWPSDDVIEFLISKSSGQFIYATTIIKFIDDNYSRPGKQLNIILSPNPSNKNIFSDLDSLYVQILSTHPDSEKLTLVLGFVLAMKRPTTKVIEDLLEFDRGDVALILQGLHSVLSGVPPEEHGPAGIQISHASFIDFLVDSHRAGPYFVDTAKYDVHIVTAVFARLSNFILSCTQGDIPPFSEPVVSSMEYLIINLVKLGSLPKCILDGVSQLEEGFRQKDFQAGASIPGGPGLESFLAIDEYLTRGMKQVKAKYVDSNGGAEWLVYWHQLRNLHYRYDRLLYISCDKILSKENHPFHLIPGILVLRESLSLEALSDLFMIDRDPIERHRRDGFQDPRLVKKLLHFLTRITFTLDENTDLCKNVQNRHLDLCHNVLSRFFVRNWDNSPKPFLKETLGYVEKQFTYHLDSLILLPSEPSFALLFLDILDEIQIPCSDVDEILPEQRWSGIWTLLKNILSWLVKVDTSIKKQTSNPSSFSIRIRSAYDRICHKIFCIVKSTRQHQEEITICIRRPFIEIEKSSWEGFGVTEGDHNPDPPVLLGILQDPVTPTSLSGDLFLLPFSDLNLDRFFTDMQRAGSNLFLPPDTFYPCILEQFRRQILVPVNEDHPTRVWQNILRAELLKTCIGYLRNACFCNSWTNDRVSTDAGPEASDLTENFKCQIFDWCRQILDTMEFADYDAADRLEIQEIMRHHTHVCV